MTVAFQQKFTDANEYAILVWGQSNARCWGDRDTEGVIQAPHLNRAVSGKDLTVNTVSPWLIPGGKTHGQAGTQSLMLVAETLNGDEWKGAQFRPQRVEFTEASPPPTRIVQCATGATCTLNVDSNLEITQGGAGTAPNKYHSVGQMVTVAGWTINSGDNINRRYQVVAVSATVWTLRPIRGTLTSVSATVSASSIVSYLGSMTYGYGTVISNTANALVVEWEVDSDVLCNAGYVFARREDGSGWWQTIESIRVLQPFTPEEPGDYPAGTPAVPGFTIPQTVDSFEKLGLFADFCWNEGVEGFGYSGSATAADATTLTDTSADWVPNICADGWVITRTAAGIPQAYARILTHTATVLTVDSWVGDEPAAGSVYEIWSPHWADSAHAAVPGAGFRKPSNDPMPTPFSSLGWNYCRPLNRRYSGYCGSIRYAWAVDATVNANKLARLKTANMTATKVGNGGVQGPYRLKIERTNNTVDPATEQIQFEYILRAGDVVSLSDWTIAGGTLDINGLWRVEVVEPVVSTDGSYVLLSPAAGQNLTSGTVSATASAATAVTRYVWRRHYRFGALVELAYRISLFLGRRINVIHLACNSAAQFLRITNNFQGYHGQIGWWDWRKHLDWTPGNPDGMAERLRLMLKTMVPGAMSAEGNTKPLRVIGIFGLQGEGDALYKVGRETYGVSLRSFYDWLRRQITEAGIAPASGVVPIVHPLITTSPWMLPPPGGGDTEGKINAAIQALANDSAMKLWTFDPDTFEKLNGSVFGTDPLHFNGVGEAKMGATAAATWATAVESSL